jgi:hypothetical protein
MNRFQGIDSASLCSLAARYDLLASYIAPIDSLKFQHRMLPPPSFSLPYLSVGGSILPLFFDRIGGDE